MNEAAGGGLAMAGLVLMVIAFVIGVLFLRWVLGTDKMVKQLRIQTELLKLIAAKGGASFEEIKEVVDRIK